MAETRPLADTLKEYGRGVVGGFLFSLPLLYTMEVWWQGESAPAGRLLAYVVGMFVLLVVYAHYVGLHADSRPVENVFEALEAVALGFVVALVVLVLTGQLPPGTSADEALGKLIFEGMAAAVGVSVGAAQLGEAPEAEDGEAAHHEPEAGLLHEVAFALLGAVLVAANVAATEEMVMIAGGTPPWALLACVGLSFVLVLTMVSYAGFQGSKQMQRRTLASRPFLGAVVTYGVALFAAAALLWVFGRFGGAGAPEVVGQTVVLGLPAALGAAAGRLLLGASS